MPAEISPSLALQLLSRPALPQVARPLARQDGHTHAALWPLARRAQIAAGAGASPDSAALALQGIDVFTIIFLNRLIKAYTLCVTMGETPIAHNLV